MKKIGSTYDLAATQIKEYVQDLSIGSRALPFDVKDEFGRSLNLMDDHLSGKSLILVFINRLSDSEQVDLLTTLAAKQQDLEAACIAVVAINSSSNAAKNLALKHACQFNGSMPGDATGAIFASYGLHKGFGPACRFVVLTTNRIVRAWFDDPADIDDLINEITKRVTKKGTAMNDSWRTPHAPVLLIPNVLTAEECGAVIQSMIEQGPFTVRKPRTGEFEGDYKIPVYEHNRQDRIDHIIKNKEMLAFLDDRISTRIIPAIKDAFAFDATKREDLHIAHYNGERSGNHMGHRDNVSQATAYRRFALSLNLNDNYDGGEVVFKEYDNSSYKSAPGSALVFSSSLLHEVEETTSGDRYTLISHFFNESSLSNK